MAPETKCLLKIPHKMWFNEPDPKRRMQFYQENLLELERWWWTILNDGDCIPCQ